MYDLDEYIKGAVSTESVKEEIKVNKKFLKHVIAMHIASGNLLDHIKKHAFYGREYDHRGMDKHIMDISDTMKQLQDMTFDELDDDEEVLNIDTRIFHAMIGTATEAVEIVEAINIDEPALDLINIGEEFGDLNWFQAIFCDASGIEWNNILDVNAEKLFKAKEARYKKGFTEDAANKRNLDAEREVLNDLNT